MSWLGILNYYFLQWTCFRLGRTVNTESGKTVGWGFVYFVKPMSGYNGNVFLYQGRRKRYLRITGERGS